MREIKFRGKRIDNGEWVYGYLLEKYTVDSIPRFAIDECWSFEDDEWTSLCVYEVNPATVGQYTGLKDKNGVEIKDGDIVWWGKNDNAPNEVVFWDDGAFWVSCEGDSRELLIDALNGLEVIGNIHDNPER
jgi:uncharacterized phage protein (TIGR01671 family)